MVAPVVTESSSGKGLRVALAKEVWNEVIRKGLFDIDSSTNVLAQISDVLCAPSMKDGQERAATPEGFRAQFASLTAVDRLHHATFCTSKRRKGRREGNVVNACLKFITLIDFPETEISLSVDIYLSFPT